VSTLVTTSHDLTQFFLKILSLPPRPSSNRVPVTGLRLDCHNGCTGAYGRQAMKTKYVIQFRSGPLKGHFVSNWSSNDWIFATTEALLCAHFFATLTTCNLMRILLEVPNDTVALAVRDPQGELELSP
jgi:hypothetical protein